jgi:opacity protein-like surface antigen
MAKIGGLKAAFGVKDLGTAVTSASGAKFSLPTHVALGAGYGMTFAEKHDVDALLDVDYYFNGGVAVAAGVEYCMDNFVFVRGGYRYGGNSPIPSFASLGAGVKFKEFKVNFAYVLGSETMANTLSICLGYTL